MTARVETAADDSLETAGVIPVHQAVPGRLRVAVAGLRGDPWLARELAARFARDPDVVSVSVSHVTGKALLHFTASLAHAALLARLRNIFAQAGGAAAEEEGFPPQPANDSHAKDGHAKDGPVEQDGGGAADLPWHALKAEAVLGRFSSSAAEGLTEGAARQALARYGANELATPPPRAPFAILLDQLTTLPVGLLVGSAAFSVLTGGLIDAGAILAVVAANAAIGYVTESQAERTINSLDRGEQPEVLLLRGGTLQHWPQRAVVPGDILALAPGMLVPADARLLEAHDLTVDESLLTGESLPVLKTGAAALPVETAQAQRWNMLYRGTAVTGGEGRAVVVATGSATEIGRIQALVGATRPPMTPLQRQLDDAGRRLGYLSLALCGGMLALGLARGYGLGPMLRSSVSLAVAALPEGLPTVATLTQALGIRDMRRRNVIVRRLNAVETLGSVHALCFDKTGTLTLNDMQAVRICVGARCVDLDGADAALASDAAFQEMLKVSALCSDVQLGPRGDGGFELRGSATEAALLRLVIDQGADPEALRNSHPLIEVTYRSEQRNYMTTRHRLPDDGELLAVKGSPEEVLALCGSVLEDGAARLLDDAGRAAIAAENDRMGRDGLRVLGFAAAGTASDRPAPPLTWLGLVGLADPLRPEMGSLIEKFRSAGLRTAMITGDQVATAYNIAQALNLSGRSNIEILEGLALDKLDPELFAGLARKTDVFARVTPANKLQIVQALQQAGEVVAMTGDGVNDSPALRAADIGIAMGSGSDAAHEVADVVLQDDRLATMLVAIGNGRSIYANIHKAVMFLLSTNLSEILLMLSSTGFRLGQPLTPAQLLYINIVTDIFPGLALGLDPPEQDVLKQPPRDPHKPVIDRKDFTRVLGEGGLITGAALLSHLVGRGRGARASAAAGYGFTTLTVAQLLHAVSCRSETQPAFGAGRRPPNPQLRWALTGLLGLQALITALPFTRGVFGLRGLGLGDAAIAAALGTAPFLLVEGAKAARLRLEAPDREKEEQTP